MTTYLVTPDDHRLPAFRVAAADLIDLGVQAAVFFTRHRRLRRGFAYDAQIGDTAGALHQPGLLQPVTFTITQEQA